LVEQCTGWSHSGVLVLVHADVLELRYTKIQCCDN